MDRPKTPRARIRNPKGREIVRPWRTNEKHLPFTDDEIEEDVQGLRGVRPDRPALDGTARMWPTSSRFRFILGCASRTSRCFTSTACCPRAKFAFSTTKAGTHVYTWVPQWLSGQNTKRAPDEARRIISGEHTAQNRLMVHYELWRRKLKIVWKECGRVEGEPDASPVPAYFRPHSPAEARRRPSGTWRITRQYGRDGSPRLFRVGSRAAGAAHEDFARGFR